MIAAEREPAAAGKLAGFLAGVRIIDLSHYIPGPMASLLLADMGAEVLKIEPPDGDEMRSLGPRDPEGRPVFYRSMNAGKTIVRMNLKDSGAKLEFLSLVADADIVIEGFRPGVLRRLGIDFPVLRAANPSIILCSISGYGSSAALSAVAGHDANYLATMGMLDRNGGDRPMFFDPPVSDLAGSLFAAIAMLGALHRQRRTGAGCEIDLGLADTVMPLQAMQVAGFGVDAVVPKRGSSYLNGGAAYYGVYPTADDGFVVVGAVEPKFWRAFCEAAGRPDWVDRHRDAFPQRALKDELAAFLSARTRAQLRALFEPADCCVSIVNDLGEALDQRQVHDRRLVRRGASGELQALFPAWIDGAPPRTRPEPVEHPAGTRATWSMPSDEAGRTVGDADGGSS